MQSFITTFLQYTFLFAKIGSISVSVASSWATSYWSGYDSLRELIVRDHADSICFHNSSLSEAATWSITRNQEVVFLLLSGGRLVALIIAFCYVASSSIMDDVNDFDFFSLQMDHPSMSGLDMLSSPHNGDSLTAGSMTSLPPSMTEPHPSQLSHHSMYSHSSSVTSMMSPHSSIGHPHHPHHPHAAPVSLPDTDTDPR